MFEFVPRALTFQIISFFAAFSLTNNAAQAQQGALEYETIGNKQFSQAHFKDAAASYRLAIYQGAKSAATWLRLGESYEQYGELNAARQTFQTIQKHFPGSPESSRATEHLAKLSAAAAAKTTAAAATTPKVAERKTLTERIYLVPPQFGHPPVSNPTIATVRRLIATLPSPVYKILDKGGTNVYLTPNLIDKWPKTVGTKNDHLGIYFAQEHGRTYGREVYLCEREAAGTGAGTELGPILSDEDIKGFLYSMLSHALNDCLELPANDPQFVAMYKMDMAGLDTSDPNLHAYIAPVEGIHDTFAALASSIMGSKSFATEYCSQKYPRCRAWIAQRIKLLSER